LTLSERVNANIFTAQRLATELGVVPATITRAVHSGRIDPDFSTGRTLLFRPRRVGAIRKTLNLPEAA
jgi:hypothetical protein